VHGCQHLRSGTKHSEVANLNFAYIENDAIEVEEYALTKLNVDAIVAEEGWLHPNGVTTCPEYFLAQVATKRFIFIAGSVEFLTQCTGATSGRDELGIKRIIELTCEHLFPFGCHRFLLAAAAPPHFIRRKAGRKFKWLSIGRFPSARASDFQRRSIFSGISMVNGETAGGT